MTLLNIYKCSSFPFLVLSVIWQLNRKRKSKQYTHLLPISQSKSVDDVPWVSRAVKIQNKLLKRRDFWKNIYTNTREGDNQVIISINGGENTMTY